MPEVQPYDAPYPNAVVGWTGVVWHVLSVDAAGRLQVRGEDQLFSFHNVLTQGWTVALTVANGYISTATPPGGECWVVHTIAGALVPRAATRIILYNQHLGLNIKVHEEVKAFIANETTHWSGTTLLLNGDVIRGRFYGGLIGDNCDLYLTGYIMTLEV